MDRMGTMESNGGLGANMPQRGTNELPYSLLNDEPPPFSQQPTSWDVQGWIAGAYMPPQGVYIPQRGSNGLLGINAPGDEPLPDSHQTTSRHYQGVWINGARAYSGKGVFQVEEVDVNGQPSWFDSVEIWNETWNPDDPRTPYRQPPHSGVWYMDTTAEYLTGICVVDPMYK